mmetsp:Transcript_4603/g.10014  ORF Transcript_4603/g.10014 Transcript_4603/m.10014 type:complete len:333 (+) Transcript_4603:196-1194(+)
MSRIITIRVTPGDECKVVLPPCSALEIKNVALDAVSSAPLTERCTLECDLATHRFVLCSLTQSGPLQAALGTVITNDPAEAAWLFLKARGPRSFHVIGRLIAEHKDEAAAPKPKARSGRMANGSATAPMSKADAAADGLDLDDNGWGLANPVKTTNARAQSGAKAVATEEMVDEEADIDVLLPDDDAQVEYPSDADSEDFVTWMQERAQKPSDGEKLPRKDKQPLLQAGATGKQGSSAAKKQKKASGKGGLPELASAPASVANGDGGAADAGGSAAAGKPAAPHGGGRSARRRAANRRHWRLGEGLNNDAEETPEPPSGNKAQKQHKNKKAV